MSLGTASSEPSRLASSRPRPDFREPGSAPRWRVGVGAVLVLVLVLVGVGIVLSAVASAGESISSGVPGAGSATVTPQPTAASAGAASLGSRAGADSPPASVYVHVLGRVQKPGLYQVEAGSRAIDVVVAAGGFASEADQAALNLARPVVDGEQIVVPRVGEAPVSQAQAGVAAGGGATGGASSTSAGTPVDVNSADQAALESLSGVGPATALAILAWREEHGRFQSVEDLLDVTGIGQKKLDAMRDSVVAR